MVIFVYLYSRGLAGTTLTVLLLEVPRMKLVYREVESALLFDIELDDCGLLLRKALQVAVRPHKPVMEVAYAVTKEVE